MGRKRWSEYLEIINDNKITGFMRGGGSSSSDIQQGLQGLQHDKLSCCERFRVLFNAYITIDRLDATLIYDDDNPQRITVDDAHAAYLILVRYAYTKKTPNVRFEIREEIAALSIALKTTQEYAGDWLCWIAEIRNYSDIKTQPEERAHSIIKKLVVTEIEMLGALDYQLVRCSLPVKTVSSMVEALDVDFKAVKKHGLFYQYGVQMMLATGNSVFIEHLDNIAKWAAFTIYNVSVLENRNTNSIFNERAQKQLLDFVGRDKINALHEETLAWNKTICTHKNECNTCRKFYVYALGEEEDDNDE